MKKMKLLYLFLLFPILGMAQSEHLKFMGIPLDGSITQFHQKLEAKGMTYNEAITKLLNDAVAFDGIFSGEKCNVFVYYNHKTETVYKAKVSIEMSNLDSSLEVLERFKKMIEDKYGEKVVESTYKGNRAYYLEVRDDKNYYGDIDLFINYQEDYNRYSLHLDYRDNENHKLNKQINMDDL